MRLLVLVCNTGWREQPRRERHRAYILLLSSQEVIEMVKKGQEQVSSLDSPRQGEKRNPNDPKIKHKGEGSRSQTRATPPGEGSSKG